MRRKTRQENRRDIKISPKENQHKTKQEKRIMEIVARCVDRRVWRVRGGRKRGRKGEWE